MGYSLHVEQWALSGMGCDLPDMFTPSYAALIGESVGTGADRAKD